MMRKAVFLDKDGTVIPDIPFNADPALITIDEKTIKGLKTLSSMGFLLVMITNQSGVARGYFPEAALQGVFAQINTLLRTEQVEIDGFYFCPHHPEGTIAPYAKACDCRKPLPGMLKQAAAEMHIDLYHSWMIGDILNDVEAGNRAGCRTILINNGNETEWILDPFRKADHTAADMEEAAAFIVQQYNAGYDGKRMDKV